MFRALSRDALYGGSALPPGVPVSEANLIRQRNVLGVAAVTETLTGIVLMAAPALLCELLLGTRPSPQAVPLCRVAGIALLALGTACWPNQPLANAGAFRGMLLYNVLIALYLAFLGTVRHLTGLLLWPVVVVHAVLALLLVWSWRKERRAA
ncbi:MAG: hypothetical protein ACLPJH_14510 [Myxococcaceae bacterium]